MLFCAASRFQWSLVHGGCIVADQLIAQLDLIDSILPVTLILVFRVCLVCVCLCVNINNDTALL